MAIPIPYTYIQCPCTSDISIAVGKGIDSTHPPGEDEGEDEQDFDPRAPRSNYSLYPLEYLLYCEDCQQIRCPRCVLEEIVSWYCPNCLFEIPGSTVKSDGNRCAYLLASITARILTLDNRCTRSCFQCPVCTSPLSVTGLENQSTGSLPGAEPATPSGPWVLSCAYCNWSSKEIGIKFDKPNSIFNQLYKMKNGGVTPKDLRDRGEARQDISNTVIIEENEKAEKLPLCDEMDIVTRFSNLKSFYQSQVAETSTSGSLSFTGDYAYGSPGALSRIMGLYTGGSFADRKSKNKAGTMREASGPSEGLYVCPETDPAVERLRAVGWAGTASREQRSLQINNPRFVSHLQPIPYPLRTKRSKRCRTCRHILSKPEPKVQTTRFRIRLVAASYIPNMAIKPLSTLPQAPGIPLLPLTPLKPTQFLLTLKNPLFDPVKVTLATPSHTPGRFSSKITILCPQFEIGANTDVWDEALQDGGDKEKGRTIREVGEGQVQAEAGKIWEKGRNWVSVVVEVVPASLRTPKALDTLYKGPEAEDEVDEDDGLQEDEDVLEIPVFVRIDWETDTAHDETGSVGAGKDKEKRALAYWCVLGVGRIAQE